MKKKATFKSVPQQTELKGRLYDQFTVWHICWNTNAEWM